jgi:hypothetical protein
MSAHQPLQEGKSVVYAVTSGAYSDYSVHCVFVRREDAEQYVALGLGEDIEEMDLHATMPEVFTVYTAQIVRQGDHYRQAGELQESSYRTTRRPEHKTSEWAWAFQAIGPDRERVIKSVRDRYAARKAQQEGVA